MKTIAYIDKCDGNKTLKGFKINDSQNHLNNLFSQKRLDRIKEALKELKGMGNIAVYLIKGNKTQRAKKLGVMKKQIEEFFQKRKINVKEFFVTCGETVEGFEDIESYNDRVAEMILKITIASQ